MSKRPLEEEEGVVPSAKRHCDAFETIRQRAGDFIAAFGALQEGKPEAITTLLGETLPSFEALAERGDHNIQGETSQSIAKDTPLLPAHVRQQLKVVAWTPWTRHDIPSSLPPLPPCSDELLKAALTHQSSIAAAKGDLMNYQRLEFLGDAFVQFLSSDLIFKTFTSFTPGKCSHTRERLVCNKILASYFERYELHKRASFPREFLPNGTLTSMKQSSKEKVYGDMFEAIVGAVLVSDPVEGWLHLYRWLKPLWAETIADDLRKLDGIPDGQPGGKTISKGPRTAQERIATMVRVPGVELTYEDQPNHKPKHQHNHKIPLFSVRLLLTGYGDHRVELGYGSGISKKEAREKAANMALESKKAVKYQDMKRDFLEARKRNMQ